MHYCSKYSRIWTDLNILQSKYSVVFRFTWNSTIRHKQFSDTILLFGKKL